MTITEFILARVDQDEGDAIAYWQDDGDGPGTWLGWVKADCEAKRRIVELHQSWPVLADRPPTFEEVDSSDPTQLTMRMTRQIAWMTEQEYRARFGDEPPTAPMLRTLAAIWADHPDYRDEWRSA